jgi:hypothetical protein
VILEFGLRGKFWRINSAFVRAMAPNPMGAIAPIGV